MVILVVVKGGESHSCLQSHEIAICVLRCIFVGKTQQFPE